MSTCYTVGDMLSLTMAQFQYPNGFVGVSTPGRMAPARAATKPTCVACMSTNAVANAQLKAELRASGSQVYLFPTYEDLCGVRYDVASPKCRICGGPKDEVVKR